MLLTGFQVRVQHQVAVSSVKLPVHVGFHVGQLQVLDPPHLQAHTISCFLLVWVFFFWRWGGGGIGHSHLHIAGSIVHHAMLRCQFRLRLELQGIDLRLIDFS